MREKIANILWGLVLIAVGIVVGGKVMGFWEFSVFFPGWWTLLIIFPCFIGMIKNGPGPVNTIIMLCGILLLLERNNVIAGNVIAKLLIPEIFFIIGLFVLFGSLFAGTRHHYNGKQAYTATFAGNAVAPSESTAFEGCAAEAVFGGLDLDLRNAVIEDGAVIEAVSIFGGVDIKVPADVNVKVKRTALFGGAKSHVENHAGRPVLYVNALCMFGGVDIK
ncbi:MAG: LiaF transmembrane domain-containing protein [Lachnospiraceae bacterium]